MNFVFQSTLQYETNKNNKSFNPIFYRRPIH